MVHTPCPAEGVLMRCLCRTPLQPRWGTRWPHQGVGTIYTSLVLALCSSNLAIEGSRVSPWLSPRTALTLTTRVWKQVVLCESSVDFLEAFWNISKLLTSAVLDGGSFVVKRWDSTVAIVVFFPLYTLFSGQSSPSDIGGALGINTYIFKGS